MLTPSSLMIVMTAVAQTTPTTAERNAEDSARCLASARLRSVPGIPRVRLSTRVTMDAQHDSNDDGDDDDRQDPQWCQQVQIVEPFDPLGP